MRTIRQICALLRLGFVLSVAFTIPANSLAQAKRAIVPSDCVTVRHFLREGFHSSLQLDPKGNRAAYLVQSPNLQTNQNDVVLEVAAVRSAERDARHLLVGTKISELHWIEDGRSIAVLAKRNGRVAIIKVAVPSGRVDVLVKAAEDIVEYSLSDDGRTIVYAVEQSGSSSAKHATADEEADGYRITMEKQATTLFPERRLFLTRKGVTGWSKPQPLSFRLPSFRKTAMVFAYALDLRLSVSPNGKSLAFTYLADPGDAPPAWQQSEMVRTLAAGAGVVQLTAVLNLSDGTASLPFEGPWAWTVPFWSRDSQSFFITAVSPVGTSWESEDGAQHRAPIDAVHQFEVRLTTGTVHLVRLDLHGIFDAPLAWRLDGDLLLHTADETLTHMRFEDGAWKDESQIRLSMPGRFRNAELASDGIFVVGDYETPSTPPSFFLYRIGESGFQHLVSLNPQFDGLTIAPYREVHWDTSTGYHASGFLFVPPDYDPQKVYPLVVHAYPAASNFFCDSGVNHDPSFAPQPLANAGIMYLIRILPDGARQGEEQAHYPKGYPGNLAEAAFHTDIWDSAVDQLSRDGLIDPKRVGIIGFSRSGWFTEFALTHGRTHYAAATLADNVQYSLGEYWMIHSDNVLKGWDAMFGGPPYGATLQNWLEHSISFNLPKVHSPVLMEVMGYGNHYLNDNAPPSNLALKWEIFAGLSRLHKPVEMYYYPLETHQPENPRARLASLERNLDWYLFWLNGVEREVARDSQQSVRWRELRQAHFADESSPAR